MITLRDIDGTTRQIVEGEPYAKRPTEEVVPSNESSSGELDELIRDSAAQGLALGEAIHYFAIPLAAIFGKQGCAGCNIRRIIGNIATRLGTPETIRLLRMSYDVSNHSYIIDELKKILG